MGVKSSIKNTLGLLSHFLNHTVSLCVSLSHFLNAYLEQFGHIFIRSARQMSLETPSDPDMFSASVVLTFWNWQSDIHTNLILTGVWSFEPLCKVTFHMNNQVLTAWKCAGLLAYLSDYRISHLSVMVGFWPQTLANIPVWSDSRSAAATRYGRPV